MRDSNTSGACGSTITQLDARPQVAQALCLCGFGSGAYAIGLAAIANLAQAECLCYLRLQIHAAKKSGKARVGAQGIKAWFNFEEFQDGAPLFIGPIQPFKCLIFLA
jgi:hypothetical protein